MLQSILIPIFIIISMGMVLLLLVWMKSYLRNATRSLEELHKKTPADSGEIRQDVWISNDQERRRGLKLSSPAPEMGFLIIDPDYLILHSINRAGQNQVRRFKRSHLKIEWLGNRFLGDANMNWFALYDGTSRVLISAYTGMNTWTSRRVTHEMYRGIVHLAPPPLSVTREFALEKNAGSLTVIILMALLTVYALGDGLFLNPLELAGKLHHYLFLLIGILLCGATSFSIALFALLRSKVPGLESFFLALFLVLIAALAAFPGAKRVDTALARTSMTQYEYRMTREGIFQPVDKSLPELDLRVKCDYWKQFEKDGQIESEHSFHFPLQQGGLGLWQLDPRPLDADIEAYLKKYPEQRRRR